MQEQGTYSILHVRMNFRAENESRFPLAHSKPKPMNTSGLIVRVVALLLVLVHLYNLLTYNPVPKWSYLLFVVSTLLLTVLNLLPYLKAKQK